MEGVHMDAQDQEIIRQLRQLDALTDGALSNWDELPSAPPPHEDKVLAFLASQGLIGVPGCDRVKVIIPIQGEDL
jgi:hypothetical protein